MPNSEISSLDNPVSLPFLVEPHDSTIKLKHKRVVESVIQDNKEATAFQKVYVLDEHHNGSWVNIPKGDTSFLRNSDAQFVLFKATSEDSYLIDISEEGVLGKGNCGTVFRSSKLTVTENGIITQVDPTATKLENFGVTQSGSVKIGGNSTLSGEARFTLPGHVETNHVGKEYSLYWPTGTVESRVWNSGRWFEYPSVEDKPVESAPDDAFMLGGYHAVIFNYVPGSAVKMSSDSARITLDGYKLKVISEFPVEYSDEYNALESGIIYLVEGSRDCILRGTDNKVYKVDLSDSNLPDLSDNINDGQFKQSILSVISEKVPVFPMYDQLRPSHKIEFSKQLFEIVNRMHTGEGATPGSFSHNDLTPEQLKIEFNKDGNFQLRVLDFGEAATFDKVITKPTGKPHYSHHSVTLASDTTPCKVTHAIDMVSAAVIAYNFMFSNYGANPFKDKDLAIQNKGTKTPAQAAAEKEFLIEKDPIKAFLEDTQLPQQNVDGLTDVIFSFFKRCVSGNPVVCPSTEQARAFFRVLEKLLFIQELLSSEEESALVNFGLDLLEIEWLYLDRELENELTKGNTNIITRERKDHYSEAIQEVMACQKEYSRLNSERSNTETYQILGERIIKAQKNYQEAEKALLDPLLVEKNRLEKTAKGLEKTAKRQNIAVLTSSITGVGVIAMGVLKVTGVAVITGSLLSNPIGWGLIGIGIACLIGAAVYKGCANHSKKIAEIKTKNVAEYKEKIKNNQDANETFKSNIQDRVSLFSAKAESLPIKMDVLPGTMGAPLTDVKETVDAKLSEIQLQVNALI